MKLEIKDFVLKYEDKYLLEIDYKFLDITRLQIEGNNGSGKTSFLNILYKLSEDYEGDVYFNGENLKTINKEELRRDISYINQSAILFENLSVLDNVRILSKGKTSETLSLIQGLKGNINMNATINSLSGGQKQIVSFAVGFMKPSKILFLDEIFNNLDKDVACKIKEMINQDHRDMIFITHSDTLAVEQRIMIKGRELLDA